jgi:hypothetical protein
MKKLLSFTAITIMSLAGCGGKTNSENSPSTTQIPWYKTMPNYSPDYSPPSNNYSPPQYNYSPPSNNYSSDDENAPEEYDLGQDCHGECSWDQ